MRAWGWAVQYGTALFLALVLGALLGSIPLFKETIPGTGRLTASDIVQFLGYGTALLMLWMGARRAATQIPEDGRGLSFLGRIVVPLTTLIVVSVGYKVLLVLVGPFLDQAGTSIYNWVFVLGIIGAALWLILAAYRSSLPLMEALPGVGRARQAAPPEASPACPQCGATVAAGIKFCGQCGQSLASALCRQCRQPLPPGQ